MLRTNCVNEIYIKKNCFTFNIINIVKMLIISIKKTVNCCNHKKENISTVFFSIKSINLELQPENQVQLQLVYRKILQRFSQKTNPLISKYCQLEHTITWSLKQT